MRLRFERWVRRCATAVAAALVVAAVGFASVGDALAQNYPKKDRAQKNATPAVKGQVQQRRNAMPGGMVPNRGGFRGQALGRCRTRARTERQQSQLQRSERGRSECRNPRASTFQAEPARPEPVKTRTPKG